MVFKSCLAAWAEPDRGIVGLRELTFLGVGVSEYYCGAFCHLLQNARTLLATFHAMLSLHLLWSRTHTCVPSVGVYSGFWVAMQFRHILCSLWQTRESHRARAPYSMSLLPEFTAPLNVPPYRLSYVFAYTSFELRFVIRRGVMFLFCCWK